MSDYILCHHGIKGQKWGVRRFQKKDGSLTPIGKKRYSEGGQADLEAKKKAMKTAKKEYSRSFDKAYNRAIGAYSPAKKHRVDAEKRWEDVQNKAKLYDTAKKDYKHAKSTEKEIRKYAQKGYAEDGYNRNKTVVGKTYDKLTGANKRYAKLLYDLSSDKENRKRAEMYLNARMEKQQYKEFIKKHGKEKGERFVKELIFAPNKERQPWDEKLPNTRSNSYPWNEKPSKSKDKYNI